MGTAAASDKHGRPVAGAEGAFARSRHEGQPPPVNDGMREEATRCTGDIYESLLPAAAPAVMEPREGSAPRLEPPAAAAADDADEEDEEEDEEEEGGTPARGAPAGGVKAELGAAPLPAETTATRSATGSTLSGAVASCTPAASSGSSAVTTTKYIQPGTRASGGTSVALFPRRQRLGLSAAAL